MKIKNLTPFPFGPKLTARKPPQMEMAVIVRGAFSLRPNEPLVPLEGLSAQGPMKAEEYLPDDDDRRGEAVYPGDFADFKLRGEVMLQGTCHAPSGRPVKECPVRFSVGAWSKILRVVGQRVWSDGVVQAFSDPRPFTKMPIRWANAFGGPGHPQNPVGKGIGTADLPSVEHPTAPIRSRGDRPDPAGFGPVSSSWPDRAGKVGTDYGAKWQKERAPFYAEDFDWSHFNAAPPDQQLEGYLRGDEEISFQNLHPTAPVFSTRLPGLRIRVFLRDDEDRFREVWMTLDTLFADLDQGLLLLTWRGLTPVKQDDLKDVETLLVASEPLADKPLPEAHYREIMEAFEKDPLGIESALQSLPPDTEGPARAALAGKPIVPAPPAPGTPPAEAIGGIVDKMPGLDPQVGAQIGATLGKVGNAGGAMGQMGEAFAGVLAALAGPLPGVSPSPALPTAPIASPLKQLAEQIAALKKIAENSKIAVPGIERVDALLADPMLKKLDPSFAAPGEPAPPPPPEPGPGVDCSGRDLSNQDLSGRDLRGANLEGAILAGAKLVNTNLAGANLKQASLSKADLTGADLTGADLTSADLTECFAPGARFDRATLDKAFLDKADLTGASLAGAHGETVFLSGANLTDARAKGLRLRKSLAEAAILERADFSEAELDGCHFLRCNGKGVVMTGALLSRSTFAGSDLSRATFVAARGERAVFQGATLARADFGHAVLPWSHFTEVSALAVRFYGANLREARFYRASLDQADFGQSNLFGADLCKAQLSGTRFTGANLYDAKLLGAAGTRTDFTGANLKRARLEQA